MAEVAPEHIGGWICDQFKFVQILNSNSGYEEHIANVYNYDWKVEIIPQRMETRSTNQNPLEETYMVEVFLIRNGGNGRTSTHIETELWSKILKLKKNLIVEFNVNMYPIGLFMQQGLNNLPIKLTVKFIKDVCLQPRLNELDIATNY